MPPEYIHTVKAARLQQDQVKQEGDQAVQLISDASDAVPKPEGTKGHNINIHA